MSFFASLAASISLRYRRAFALHNARRSFRKSNAKIAAEWSDFCFETALWEHHCRLACKTSAGWDLDTEHQACSKCPQEILGVRVSDLCGGYVHWGCSPLEARDSVLDHS